MQRCSSRKTIQTMVLVSVTILLGLPAYFALAQTEEDGNVAPEAPPVEADAQPAPAAEEAPPASNDNATSAESDPAENPPSYLMYFVGALGWKYTIAFLFLSVTLVALVVMNLLAVRRDEVVPIGLIEQFEEYLNDKKYQEAYELSVEDDSFLGRVLSAGLARLKSGYPQAIEAMQEVGEEENMKLEHSLSYIALIGSISPMVGLLGTVDGMVSAFSVIAQSTQAPSPPELAGDISTALITTLAGLWLAIPAISVYFILRNRVARLTLEVGVISEQLMSRFQSVGGKKL